ncbi:MAG TPA: hypothetical protein VML19_28280 [Verrucomicrobiae bacterium]|nr:hypothetical protein [Verrucomicrobiae bacterium]
MLLNWDDATNRDLVFLGSPSENLSLRELPLGREFRFENAQTEDYAVVELAPLTALLHIKVNRGVPVESALVLLRI